VTAKRIGGEREGDFTDNFTVCNEFRLLLTCFVPFSAMMQLVHQRYALGMILLFPHFGLITYIFST